MKFDRLPSSEVVAKTVLALEKSGIHTVIAQNGQDACKKVFEFLPQGAEVMTMASVTLESLGITQEVNESGRYDSVKNKLSKMERKTEHSEMQKFGAAPEWAIGSVHAVTMDGKVLIASNTGSQLPAYAYGASNIIWVVGMQKIVKNFDEALKRIYEHSLILESERARKAYGVAGSNVSKILIINRENQKGRIHLIFVPELIGY